MNNKEFEVKLELTHDEAEKIYNFIRDDLKGKLEWQKDIYYCPDGVNIKAFMEKKCIRIRTHNNIKTLDYKEIIDENSKYMQKLVEYSTEIENENSMSIILQQLGFKPVLEVNKKRIESIYKEIFKVALDNVEKLGWFIEIELLQFDYDENILEKLMKNAIKDLGIKIVRVNKIGYSNMLLDINYGEKK